MNVNETIATEAAAGGDEKSLVIPKEPVSHANAQSAPVQEGKTVGKPYIDNAKFRLRNVEVFYGEDRAI